MPGIQPQSPNRLSFRPILVITIAIALMGLLHGCTPVITGGEPAASSLVTTIPVLTGPTATQTTSAPSVVASTTPLPLSNSATISGIVWHDLCMAGVPGQPGPAEAPAGCIPGEQGGYRANGIYEAAEPAIAGVLVSLGYGDCGATDDYYELVTGADGTFTFAELSAGRYCLVVDPLRPENARLLPGGWTYPNLGEAAGFIRIPITLADHEQKHGVHVGWDHQFLPALEPVQATPLPQGGCNNSASCEPVGSTEIEPSSISGLVWNDDCRLLGGENGGPATPSGGCVLGSDGVYRVIGVTRLVAA